MAESAHFHSNNKASENLHRQQTYPCIIACGYRQVWIPKTNRTFPAWLIAFDDATEQEKRTTWRTKHDISLLHRAAKTAHIQFPKAVFAKLVEAAPWKSPDLLEDDGAASEKEWNELTCINHWNKNMQKNLWRINQFLQEYSKSRVENVMGAWKIFARLGDTEFVLPVARDLETSNHQREQISHELGQYFCSPENAIFLVQTCLERISRLVSQTETRDFVFIEPSVGRGDILVALRDHLSSNQSVFATTHLTQFLGFDLDSAAVDACRQRFEAGAGNTIINQADFLQTKRNDHLQGDACVSFLGGPPYTASHNNDTQSSLDKYIPMRFVEHAIHEWKAQLVAFIMPRRCKSHAYESLPSNYLYETIELPSSTFYFQGNVAVQQPSVLQFFWLNNSKGRIRVHDT
jgi:hypothetical protein